MDYVSREIHLKLQRSFDRLVGWWLAAEKEATVTDLWWKEQDTKIQQLEAKYKLLKTEYDRLSDMVDFLVKKVHHLETTE